MWFFIVSGKSPSILSTKWPLEAKGGGFLGSKEEGFSGIHSSSSSWALGKTFSVNSAAALIFGDQKLIGTRNLL
jgi:hypothetical protein